VGFLLYLTKEIVEHFNRLVSSDAICQSPKAYFNIEMLIRTSTYELPYKCPTDVRLATKMLALLADFCA
jgi:hypothetical protein